MRPTIFGLMPLLWACEGGGSPPAPPEEAPQASGPAPRNLLVIVEDTLRSDAIGAWGAPGQATPHIDALASQGTLFPEAVAQSTYTPGSFVSYMTSSHVRTHGWNYNLSKVETHRAVRKDLVTLAQVLKGAGFTTAGVMCNRHLVGDLEFDRGFDSWTRSKDDAAAVDLALAELDGWSDGKRHFLYVHTMSPHLPYSPSLEAQKLMGVPEGFVPEGGLETKWVRNYVEKAPEAERAARIANLRKVYAAMVYDGDQHIGRILAGLEERGLADDTVVGFWADHGEEFWEHVFSHFRGVYDHLAHVPLILKVPGKAPARVGGGVARLMDLPPTLVSALQVSGAPASWQGQDLFGAGLSPLVFTERDDDVGITYADGMKAIHDGKRWLYYDLKVDPDEQRPIKPPPADRVAKVEADHAAWMARVPKADPAEDGATLDEAQQAEELERLKALGYVEE